MTKDEAARYLNVSTRAVERYTSQGKLSVHYEKGKTRPVAVYDESELRALKAEIENPAVHRPAVERPKASPANESSGQALITTKPDQSLAEFVEIFREAFNSARRPPVSIAEIAHKTMLTLPEAAALTSLSRNHLRAAISEGKLKARIIGKGWRVKRTDLDAYVRKL